jgi:hypothetical protein
MHDWPGSREEFFDLGGKKIAAISGSEIKRLQPKDTPAVLLLSPTGIALATHDYWERWQEELRSQAPSQ